MRGIARRRSGVVNAGVLGESPEETAARLDALIERYYPTLPAGESHLNFWLETMAVLRFD